MGPCDQHSIDCPAMYNNVTQPQSMAKPSLFQPSLRYQITFLSHKIFLKQLFVQKSRPAISQYHSRQNTNQKLYYTNLRHGLITPSTENYEALPCRKFLSRFLTMFQTWRSVLRHLLPHFQFYDNRWLKKCSQRSFEVSRFHGSIFSVTGL